MAQIKLVVIDGHTLAYQTERLPFGHGFILHDSVLKGSPRPTNATNQYVIANKSVILARRKDLDEFRLYYSEKSYLNEEIYQLAKPVQKGESYMNVKAVNEFFKNDFTFLYAITIYHGGSDERYYSTSELARFIGEETYYRLECNVNQWLPSENAEA